MKNIFAHIAGISIETKQLIHNSLSKKIFEIIDLDAITEKIINDKNMLYLYNRDEYYKNKLKDQNLSKINIKQINNTIKKIDQKMNLYWKIHFENAINNLSSKYDKLIILLGYNTYFKNHKIYVNINTDHKYILKVNLLEHAKNVVATNLKEYYEDIINGRLSFKQPKVRTETYDISVKNYIQMNNSLPRELLKVFKFKKFEENSIHMWFNTL